MYRLVEAGAAFISRMRRPSEKQPHLVEQLKHIADRQRWYARQQKVDEFLQRSGAEDLLLEVLNEDGFAPEVMPPTFNGSHETRFILGRSLLKTTNLLFWDQICGKTKEHCGKS